jgi:hypothetical protein
MDNPPEPSSRGQSFAGRNLFRAIFTWKVLLYQDHSLDDLSPPSIWDGRCFKTIFTWTILSSSPGSPSFFLPVAPIEAKYEMTFFVFSVLPAPDSPLQEVVHTTAQLIQINHLKDEKSHDQPFLVDKIIYDQHWYVERL